MEKPKFINGYFYHIYNRGVEKRPIFGNNDDRHRFLHDLYEFNDRAPAGKFSRKHSEVEPPTFRGSTSEYKKRSALVKIHAFCLMPNHFHLLLEQIDDNGVVQFMKKLSTGYTMYFNEKNKRVGHLFQGRFKALHVDDDGYLLHLSRYIHLNPVELIKKDWKENGITNWKKINNFLNSYRWSSYQDYIGIKNYPSLIERNFIYIVLDEKRRNSEKLYQSFVNEWLTKDSITIEHLTFE